MYGNYYGYPAPNQLDQYKQPYQRQYPTQQIQADERIWVNGETQAQDYLIAPNGFVRLWDSTRPLFYEKRADASGRPFIETFEYVRKTPNTAEETKDSGIDYMSILNALNERVNVLEEVIKNEQSNADDK